MLSLVEEIGKTSIGGVRRLGRVVVFFVTAFLYSFIPPFRLRNVAKQVEFIGAKSLGVIALTAAFSGMVLALQGYYSLRKFGSEGLLGSAVALSLVRELGPVLSALMVAGRAGSALTAEIGIMRIREQIASLEVMGVDPVKYLVSPRLLGGLVSLPLLTAVFDVVGILGGYLVAVELLGIDSGAYFGQMEASVDMRDITGGFIKSVVFGLLIAWICTFKGYYTQRGAEGVSRSTTSAVVTSSVLVLVGDYVLTSVLL